MKPFFIFSSFHLFIFSSLFSLLTATTSSAQTFDNYQLDLGGTSPQDFFTPDGWSRIEPYKTKRDNFDSDYLYFVDMIQWSTTPSTMAWSSQDTALLVSKFHIPGTGDSYEPLTNTITGLTPGQQYTWSFEAVAVSKNASNAVLEVTFDGISGGKYQLDPQHPAPQRYGFTFTADADGTSQVILFEGNEQTGATKGSLHFLVLGGSGEFTPVPEPSASLLLSATTLGLILRRRR